MFERFTEKAIKSIMLAQDEARSLGHNFVGSEQLLVGLLREGTGLAARALSACHVELDALRKEVEKIIGRGSGFVAVEVPFTPRAKRALEQAWDSARQRAHNYIDTEHLLLGVLMQEEGVALRALNNLGVSADAVKTELEKLFAPPGSTQVPPGREGEFISRTAPAACPWCAAPAQAMAILCAKCNRPLEEHSRRCSACKEIIWKDAVLCRYCGTRQDH